MNREELPRIRLKVATNAGINILCTALRTWRVVEWLPHIEEAYREVKEDQQGDEDSKKRFIKAIRIKKASSQAISLKIMMKCNAKLPSHRSTKRKAKKKRRLKRLKRNRRSKILWKINKKSSESNKKKRRQRWKMNWLNLPSKKNPKRSTKQKHRLKPNHRLHQKSNPQKRKNTKKQNQLPTTTTKNSRKRTLKPRISKQKDQTSSKTSTFPNQNLLCTFQQSLRNHKPNLQRIILMIRQVLRLHQMTNDSLCIYIHSNKYHQSNTAQPDASRFPVLIIQSHPFGVLNRPLQLIFEVLRLHLAFGLQLQRPRRTYDDQTSSDVLDIVTFQVILCSFFDHFSYS